MEALRSARQCAGDLTPPSLKKLGVDLHDRTIRHVKPASLTTQVLGVPAVKTVFANMKLRLIDEDYMPLFLQKAIRGILDNQSNAMIERLNAKFNKTIEEEAEERLAMRARPRRSSSPTGSACMCPKAISTPRWRSRRWSRA